MVADTSSTDSDKLTVNVTAGTAAAGSATATIVGIENTEFNYSTVGTTATTATGISTGLITVNQLLAGGGADAGVTGINSVGIKAGSGVTGTLALTTITAGSAVTVDAGSAAAVTATTVTTGSIGVTGGSKLAAVTLVGHTASVTTAADAATLTVTGTAATDDVLTVSAGKAVTVANNATNFETISVSGTVDTVATITTTAATTYVATGAKNVTFAGDEAFFDGKTVTDSSTGTTTVKLTNTVASDSDLSKIGADVINQNGVLNGAASYTLKSGAVLDVTAAQTAVITLVAGTKAITTDSITVNAKDAATVLITSDSTTAASEVAFNTINFNATTADTTLTAITGKGAIVVGGNKAVAVAAASTAASVDASALTGALTVTLDGTSDIAAITGGSGNDVFTAATAANTSKIAGGAGADTLNLNFAGTIAGLEWSGIETVALGANVTGAKLSQFDVAPGATMIVGGAQTVTFGTGTALDLSTVDFSKLTMGAAAVTSFTIDATAGLSSAKFLSTQGLTFTGSDTVDAVTGTANADVISGGKGDDVLIGLAGVDTITGGEGADTITAGVGADVINLTETTAAADTVAINLATEYGDTVTGFAAGAGVDVIQLKQALAGSADTTLDAGAGAASVAAGVITKATIAIETKEAVLVGGTVNAAATNKVAAADLADATKTAALLGDTVTVTDAGAAGADSALFVVEASDSTTTAASFAVWSWTQGSATDTTIDAAELTLVGKFAGTGTVVLADITLIA